MSPCAPVLLNSFAPRRIQFLRLFRKRRTVLAVQARTPAEGVLLSALVRVQERSASARLGIVAATCWPDPVQALREVQAVSLLALMESWAATAEVFAGLMDTPAAVDDPLVTLMLSGLSDEERWLRALVRLVDRHLKPSVSEATRLQAVRELNAAFSQLS